jgi:hypothetical protein
MVICTTRRFIYLENGSIQALTYSEFKNHTGFKSIDIQGNSRTSFGVKTEGYIAEFGLRKKDGQIVYWKIPTGKSGFAFWNVTKSSN